MNKPIWPRLLLSLKVTVESLLERQVSDVWNVYGGLNRYCSTLLKILYNGYKICDDKGSPDLWPFIQGLNWLQPSHHGCISPGIGAVHFPEAVKTNRGMHWVYYHVENHGISEKLSWLMSDREHLLSCYHEDAFLCQPKYAEAILICIKAVEQNQLGLLADVDPTLYVIPYGQSGFAKVHRRCSSFPLHRESERQKAQDIEMPVFAGGTSSQWDRVVTGLGVIHGSIPRQGVWPENPPRPKTPLRKCRSLPAIFIDTERKPSRVRSKTIVSKISPSVLKVEYADSSRKDRSGKSRKKRERERRTFMDDGGTSVRVAATGYFPRPSQGQSLSSFLSTGNFTSADLDRENAHFRISEAMISAIEQVKCNRELRLMDVDSDESVAARPRMRRRNRVPTCRRIRGGWSERADTTASEQTPSPPTSTPSASDDETGSDAEQLALSLLRQFEDTQLPRASELEWLVAPEDTPQELLPLPGGWPVPPDLPCATPLRGTAEWAPPRPQLIFTPHPPPVRKILLAKQNLRCAGCGSKVAVEYACRFRYCDYLGRYFCTGCHTNQLAAIPGRVIAHWDFNRYPVSNFSFRLLDKMETDPLFRIDDLNARLYRKVKALERTRTFRIQISHLKEFLLICRFADHLKELLTNQPSYSLSEPDRFSLNDLYRVKTGDLPTELQAVVRTGLAHVATCQLCQARGFICELCPCKAVIFPWALSEVARCPKCGTCFHIKCFKPPTCPRCIRMEARKKNSKI